MRGFFRAVASKKTKHAAPMDPAYDEGHERSKVRILTVRRTSVKNQAYGADPKASARDADGGINGAWWAAVATYVTVAFGAAVALLVLGVHTDNELLGALGQATPALAALLAIVVFPGRAENLRRLGLHRLSGSRWYALALLIPVLPIGLSYFGGAALGFLDYRWPLDDAGMLGLTLFRATAGYLIVTAVPLVWALGEEIGWRGWLQSHLVPALGVRRAVLLVGLIWGVWHYPFIFWGGYYEDGISWLNAALLTCAVVPIAIVFGWVRLSSRSLWPVVLLHAATNAARLVWDATFVPASPNWVYVAGEAGVISIAIWLVLAWWVWKRLPTGGRTAAPGNCQRGRLPPRRSGNPVYVPGGRRAGMRSFFRAVASEEMKHRRTLTRRLLVVGPGVLVACYAMVGLLSGHATTWELFIEATFNWWAALWVPAGAALLCALASSTETRAGAWRTLRARPISPAVLYGAKLAVLALHTLVGAVLLAAVTAALGTVLIGGPVPLGNLILLALLPWLAALPLLAIGLWASVAAGFWAPVALGTAGLLAGAPAAETPKWGFVPWAWPVRVSLPLAQTHANGTLLQAGDPMGSLAIVPPVIAVSLTAATVLTLAGSLWFSRREVR